MTAMPSELAQHSGDGLIAVIAAQQSQLLSKQGEMGEKLAAISEQLRPLAATDSDHEMRIRALEVEAAKSTGGRDLVARFAGLIAVGAAAADVTARLLGH